MVHLNQNEEVAVRGMVEKSHMMRETITNDDVDFFNLNYGDARTEDPARLAAISKNIKEIMKIDLEGAEILKNVYVKEYNDAQAELTRINTDANISGLKKVFNSRKRSRARAQQAEVLNKRTLLAQRKEFDGMYDESLQEVCTRYEVVSRNSLLYSEEKTKLDRMLSNLHYYGKTYNDPRAKTEDENKLFFLRDDKSSMPTLKKLTYYSEMDRDYKDASANFRAVYSDEIKTDWITRDIVGYTCMIDGIDHNVDGCINHARNLKTINEEKYNTDELREAVFQEKRFLTTQVFDLDRWKTENAELFGEKAPDGFTALMKYTVLQRAFKKLQISKTVIEKIMNTTYYRGLDRWNREEFENETVVPFFAMHSYVTGLIGSANRHYNVLQGERPEEIKTLSWEETGKLAAKAVSDFYK